MSTCTTCPDKATDNNNSNTAFVVDGITYVSAQAAKNIRNNLKSEPTKL